MNQTMQTRNPWKAAAKMLIAVLAVLVVALVYMLHQDATTGPDSRGAHETRATGGSSITKDPYIEHHAEIVARYR